MNYLTLFLTEKCTRKCEYCDIGVSSNRRLPDTYLIHKFIPIIRDSEWSRIHLTGGEVSLLDPDTLDFIITTLKCKDIGVNTNGAWFKLGYFDKYYDMVESIQYHPVSEIDIPFDDIFDYKITYNFPIHKKNFHLVGDLLDNHPGIQIKLTPYNEKYETSEFWMSPDEIRYVYSTIYDRPNVTIGTKNIFKLLAKEVPTGSIREYCRSSIVMYPSIDFVNGTIKKCIKSHTRSSSLPLTEENFRNIKNLKFGISNLCDVCTLYLSDVNTIIKEYVRYKA